MTNEQYSNTTPASEITPDEPMVYIRRSNGEIQRVTLTNEFDDQGRQYITFFEDGEEVFKPIGPRNLTEDAQREFALAYESALEDTKNEHTTELPQFGYDLADTAIESAGIEKPALKLRREDIVSAEEKLAKLKNTKDEILKDFINKLGDTPAAVRAAIDPNSGNEALRNELLFMIKRRIDMLGEQGKLPERVQRNSPGDQKATDMRFNHAEKMSPREYASRLTLAMMDGSFDEEKSKASRYDDLPIDSPHNGQHRQSAEILLESLYGEETIADQSMEKSLREILQSNRERFEDINSASHRAIRMLELISEDVRLPMINLQELAHMSNDLLSTLDNIIVELNNVKGLVQKDLEDDSSIEDYINNLDRISGQIDGVRQSGLLRTLNHLRHVGNLDSMEVDQLRIYAMRESEEIRQIITRLQKTAIDSIQ